MACSGTRYGLSNSTAAFIDDRSSRIFGFSNLRSLSIPNLAVKNSFPIISATPAVVSDRPVSNQISSFSNFDLVLDDKIVNDREFHDRTIEFPKVPENLDELIQSSVTEIVKNITQAPLLLQIYSNGEFQMEKAVKAKNWPNVITQRPSSPAGIILVEELHDNNSDRKSGNELKDEGGSRAFGVLIQGKVKGRDYCKSACYLLKTSSVNGGGLGFVCTHYCLMRVNSFKESAFSQFNDTWLVT